MVLTVSFVLSSAIGLCCHRRLDASVEASGRHDFIVREQALSSATPSAFTASRPNVRDDGQRPSSGQDGGSYGSDLGQAKTEIFFEIGLDCWNQIDLVQQITQSAHPVGLAGTTQGVLVPHMLPL
jgi:hypothetical protein